MPPVRWRRAGKLQDVVGQQRRGKVRAEPGAHGIAHPQEHVQPGRHRNQRQADADVRTGTPGRSRRSRPSAAAPRRRTSAGARPSAAASGFRSPPSGPFGLAHGSYARVDASFGVHDRELCRTPCFRPAGTPDKWTTVHSTWPAANCAQARIGRRPASICIKSMQKPISGFTIGMEHSMKVRAQQSAPQAPTTLFRTCAPSMAGRHAYASCQCSDHGQPHRAAIRERSCARSRHRSEFSSGANRSC